MTTRLRSQAILTGSAVLLLCLIMAAPALAQRPSLGGLQTQIDANAATGSANTNDISTNEANTQIAQDTADTNTSNMCILACATGVAMSIPGCVCPPTVDDPLVDGSTNVTGTGIAGADIDILVDGSVSGSAVVGGDTLWDGTVSSSLIEDEVVTAVQTDGGFTSLSSNAVTVVAGEKHVFVTSTAHNGNLGGIAGADAICQARADAASLPGTYLAWLSDGTTSPDQRFVKSTAPYTRVDGVKIADDYNDLVDGSLMAPVAVDEFGGNGGNQSVWTSTRRDGSLFGNVGFCANWNNASIQGIGDIGSSSSTTSGWTEGLFLPCSFESRLYCFQQ